MPCFIKIQSSCNCSYCAINCFDRPMTIIGWQGFVFYSMTSKRYSLTSVEVGKRREEVGMARVEYGKARVA